MTELRENPSLESVVDADDDDVGHLLAALASETRRAERADLAHRLVGAVATHDAVVAEALIPLLRRLAGGTPVAAEMAAGCADRERTTTEIHSIIANVQPRDVYLAGGDRLEAALSEMAVSFEHHHDIEVPKAVEVLDAAQVPAGEIVAALARARHWAPTRPHHGPLAHRRATAAKALLHFLDRRLDHWDHREGWSLDGS
ncbi:MAG TPA: hypothetical protein VFP54_06850 [Acidimicrobiales bacterium]|nr:hypothetical protein [Acidimicrobiales bacterium]